MQTQIETNRKIDEIFSALNSSASTENYGILGGELGKALFYLYYSDYKCDQIYLEKAARIIVKTTANLPKLLGDDISLSRGLTSLAWIIAHIEKYKLFDTNSTKLLNQLDLILLTKATNDLEKGKYDYLHGALSVANYFLIRKKTKKNIHYLERIVLHLDEMAFKEEGYIKWNHFDHENLTTIPGIYNLGLSHGMPSIIMFLINCFELGICSELSKTLAKGSIEFIVSEIQDMNQIGSAFGYESDDGMLTPPTKSRLAWCYGDLGILYVLIRAAKTFKLDHLNPIIDAISLFECSRKDLLRDSVNDAGFCHGSSGISHIFLKLHQLTGRNDFLDCSKYWLNKTLKMDYHVNGLAGYKTFRVDSPEKYSNDYSLIEGIPGIGLTLISSATNKEYHWDDLFILK